MSALATLYVIMRDTGEYSQRVVAPIAVFREETLAQAFCDKATAQRNAAVAANPYAYGDQYTPKGHERTHAARYALLAASVDPGADEDSSWYVEEVPLLEQVP